MPRKGQKMHRRYMRLVDELFAETPRGLCPYCDRPLPPRRWRLCGKRDCLRGYHQDIRAERQRLGDPSYATKPASELTPQQRERKNARRRAARLRGGMDC